MQIKVRTSLSSLIIMMLLAASFPAQDFSFTTPDNETVTLASMRGKVVVMLFASTSDPQCRDEFKAIGALTERYRSKPVSIYWISLDPASVGNEKLKNPCGPTGPIVVLRDQNRAAFKRFSGRTPQLPTIVVLDQQGQPQGQPRGGFNPDSDFINDMAAVIDGILEHK